MGVNGAGSGCDIVLDALSYEEASAVLYLVFEGAEEVLALRVIARSLLADGV